MLQETVRLLRLNSLSQGRPFSQRWTLSSKAQIKIDSSDHSSFQSHYRGEGTSISVIYHESIRTSSSRNEVNAHRNGRPCLTICRSESERTTSSADESDVPAAPEKGITLSQFDSDDSSIFGFLDGPGESSGPKFSRLPHSPLSFIPVNDPAAALPPATKIKLKQGIRRGRRAWKKITAPEAMTGAVVGAVWAVLALKGTTLAYEQLESHPLARDLPMGLTKQANQLLLTTVSGLGGFAVMIFSVTSCGLLLLSFKLLSTPKPPAS